MTGVDGSNDELKENFAAEVSRLTEFANKVLDQRLATSLDVLTDSGYWRVLSRLIFHEAQSKEHQKVTSEDVLISEFQDCTWRELPDK